MTSAKVGTMLRPFCASSIGSAVVLLVSFCTYRLHFNLFRSRLPRYTDRPFYYSFITLWLGFWQASATSFAAVACVAKLGR
jgi:hypothetical protein